MIDISSGYFVLFACAILLIKLLYADGVGSLWQRTRFTKDGTVNGVELPLQANFGNSAMLLGVDGLPSAIPGDSTPEIALYWRVLNPGDGDWQVSLSLEGADGEFRHEIGLRPARWARTPPPMLEWAQDKYARMDFVLELPPGIPPGHYTVLIKLFDRDTLRPASVLGADGNPLGPELLVQKVTLKAPDKPYPLSGLGVPDTAESTPCGPLKLWWMEADRKIAAPGELVVIRRVWEADKNPLGDYSVPLTLLDDQDNVLWLWDMPLVASWWPTGVWQAGDRWVGTLGVRLPGSLESGSYTIRTGQRLCETPTSIPLEVVAPNRLWAVPAGYKAAEFILDDLITLKGYQLEPGAVQPGDTVALSLAWQTLAPLEVSYRVFVHLTGEDGHLLAQSDGEPAGWTRPTPGWAVGEIVVDGRPISIPLDAEPGTYILTTGVYNTDGTRLILPNGEDAIRIGSIVVE